MARGILTINAGSSSIKFALFELDGGLTAQPVVSGQIDGIVGRIIEAYEADEAKG